MPVGTPFHPRTAALSQSLAWREWSGYYAASSYETHHAHEYNAIRNASALIDVSPLYKYRLRGPGAVQLLDRVLTRDAWRIQVGQVAYTSWCNAAGKIIDDGTVQRLDEQEFRWTAAEPTLRWAHQNASGLEVEIREESESTAALALQGPTSRELLRAVSDLDADALRYFRIARCRIAGIPVEVSRTGYTGDLGYEIWVAAERAVDLWDALVGNGSAYGLQPAGMLALDVARIEAGLVLLEVDYVGARTALTASQLYTPFELGLGRLVHVDKAPFVGQQALRAEKRRGPRRELVGLELDWVEFEKLHEEAGLPPQVPAAASRAAVPIYRDDAQVGKATSTTWSPTLKKLIALATVESACAHPGSRLLCEVTVDHRRRRCGAQVVPLPFFDPPRKRA
jgi:aminomethyltransferase